MQWINTSITDTSIPIKFPLITVFVMRRTLYLGNMLALSVHHQWLLPLTQYIIIRHSQLEYMNLSN